MKTQYKVNGSLDIEKTLDSMEVGEKWDAEGYEGTTRSLRTIACLLGRVVNKSFTVNAPACNEGRIIVTRTR